MFPNMHFPAYNNADYIRTANQILSKFTLLLHIHGSTSSYILSIIVRSWRTCFVSLRSECCDMNILLLRVAVFNCAIYVCILVFIFPSLHRILVVIREAVFGYSAILRLWASFHWEFNPDIIRIQKPTNYVEYSPVTVGWQENIWL